MSKKNCTCDCAQHKKVLTVTQLENSTVLSPENLENRDKILVLSKNINNAYMVKVMSTLTVKAMVEAIQDSDVAFLLVEMKEPPAKEEPPEEPPKQDSEGEDDPEPDDPDDPEKSKDGAGTEDEQKNGEEGVG